MAASIGSENRDLSVLRDIGDRTKAHGFYSTKSQNPKARDIFNQPLVFPTGEYSDKEAYVRSAYKGAQLKTSFV